MANTIFGHVEIYDKDFKSVTGKLLKFKIGNVTMIITDDVRVQILNVLNSTSGKEVTY